MSGDEIAKGLLYVEMECPPQMEEEFHSWYNTEHLPERAAVPGFVRSQRFAALEGAPRWVAPYELESVGVLETPEYLRCSGSSQSPWTERVVTRVSVYRGVYELAWGEMAPVGSQSDKDARGLLAVRYDGAQDEVEKIKSWHDGEFAPRLLQLPGVLTARRYRGAAPGSDQLALYELCDPWVVQSSEFVKLWKEGWEVRRRDLPAFKRVLYVRILPIG